MTIQINCFLKQTKPNYITINFHYLTSSPKAGEDILAEETRSFSGFKFEDVSSLRLGSSLSCGLLSNSALSTE